MVVKKRTSWSFLFLALWSISKFHQRSGSLLELYRHLGKKMRKLTYYLNFKFLILIVWSNLTGSSMCRIPSIMPTNLHCSAGIQSRNSYISEERIYMSLVLVARLMEILRLPIPLSKTFKLTWRNIRWIILEIFILLYHSTYSQGNHAMLKLFYCAMVQYWNGSIVMWFYYV